MQSSTRTSELRARYTEESDAAPEVSVVMPCLNEADTLESCIQKAKQAFWESKIVGEIIVADNGSTDTSPNIARGVTLSMLGFQTVLSSFSPAF